MPDDACRLAKVEQRIETQKEIDQMNNYMVNHEQIA